MGEQIELGKPTLFWGKVGDAELKPLEVVEGDFNVEPLEEPIEIKYAPTPTWRQEDNKGFSASFDFTLDKKSAKNIRKMLYTRVPRKKKKWQKKQVSIIDGKPVKHLRYDYLGCYYWIK